MITRRTWLESLGAGALALSGATLPACSARRAAQPATPTADLKLVDFQPKSMLHVPVTRVERAKFPVVDVHAHLSWAKDMRGGVGVSEERVWWGKPEQLIEVMDRKNVQTLVNLTGGWGTGLEQAIAMFDRKFPGRFVTLTEPAYGRFLDAKYAQLQADEIERAKRAGARGLKVLKTLGLFLREQIDHGPLVAIDDRRFDPMWDACAAQGLPVFIHVSDPEAFFLPIDRFNERYEELANHPDWSFHGKDFPSNAALLEARNRVFERHPRTQFVMLHMGNNAENLGYVAECLDRYPNTTVEMGARVGELGRQPRTSRRFFDKYQDRIMFGTDAVPPPFGDPTPQQIFGDALYEIYYRFLETEDEYFDYAPAPVPPQGRWAIYGIALPDAILQKIYRDNAARVLGLS